MNKTLPENVYFKNLDALRFLSFLGVFISHTLVFPTPSTGWKGFLISIFSMDALMVPFFFTLSSFLITYRLLVEKEKNGMIHLLRFYKNRALRIWPAYFLLVIICFALIPFAIKLLHLAPVTLPSIFPFLFFYVNFYIIENGEAFTFALLILWSISVEEQFYVVWGAVLKFISTKALFALIAALFIMSIAFGYFYLFIKHGAANNLVIHSIFILQFFCTGALIAYLHLTNPLLLSKIPTAVFIGFYLVLFTANYYLKDLIILNAIKSICYSMIIYDQALNSRRVFNLGRNQVINYLGKISYGLYLYRALIVVILQKQFHLFEINSNYSIAFNLLQMIVALSMTIFVAHLSYRFIESKFLQMKHQHKDFRKVASLVK